MLVLFSLKHAHDHPNLLEPLQCEPFAINLVRAHHNCIMLTQRGGGEIVQSIPWLPTLLSSLKVLLCPTQTSLMCTWACINGNRVCVCVLVLCASVSLCVCPSAMVLPCNVCPIVHYIGWVGFFHVCMSTLKLCHDWMSACTHLNHVVMIGCMHVHT